MRTKIILQLAEGLTPSGVVAAQRTTARTVHRWRDWFEAEGIEGLLECARFGCPTVSRPRSTSFRNENPGSPVTVLFWHVPRCITDNRDLVDLAELG